jgi:hypothetical protein
MTLMTFVAEFSFFGYSSFRRRNWCWSAAIVQVMVSVKIGKGAEKPLHAKTASNDIRGT